MTKKFCLSAISLAFMVSLQADSLYQQLSSEMLKHVHVETPQESEEVLINAFRAHEQHGTQFSEVSVENWNALKSVSVISDILPKYQKTETTSGSIALGKQVSQITDDIQVLQQRAELTEYFRTHPNLLNKITQQLKRGSLSEPFFFRLFRAITEEEQAQLDTIDNQLYFTYSWLSGLNESQLALEIGPRINQLHTAFWYTIPAIFASGIHAYFIQTEKLKSTANNLKYLQEKTPKELLEKLDDDYANDKEYLKKDQEYYTYDYTTGKHELKTRSTPPNELAFRLSQLEKEYLAKKQKLQSYENLSSQELTDLYKAAQEEYTDYKKVLDQKFIDLLQKYADSLQKDSETRALSQDEATFITVLNAYKKDPNSYFFDSLMKLFFRVAPKTTSIKNAVQFYIPLGCSNLYNAASDTVSFTGTLLSTLGSGIYHNVLYEQFKNNLVNNSKWDPNAWSTMAAASGMTAGLCTVSAVIYGALLGAYPYLLYKRFQSTKNLMTIIHEKQVEVITMGHWVKSMHTLYVLIGQDPTLKRLMKTEYAQLDELFNPNNKKASADVQRLMNKLLSSSFQGSDSYLLSQYGKILTTHHIMCRIKGDLVPYFETFGQIDAYASTCKLYKEFQNHPRVHFCLPTFIDQYEPVLDITEYWHPLIDPMRVVSNSLAMGTNGIKDVMITGPNAGGKTTSLMSLIINIIFAQSLAIAPSSSMVFTPFAKIHSYLDITTNLQEGLSLFAAEVDRAKKLKQSIMSCLPGQKTFTIIDEIFSGTAPQVASDVGYTFAKQLGETAHSMAIITTHFPRLTDLEKDLGLFTNYKVADATIMPDGKIVYPFKLVPGISNQNIAQHMLEQQGII